MGTVVHAHVDKLVNHIALTGDSLSGFIRVLHFAVGIVSGGAGMQVFQLQNFEERLRQLRTSITAFQLVLLLDGIDQLALALRQRVCVSLW